MQCWIRWGDDSLQWVNKNLERTSATVPQNLPDGGAEANLVIKPKFEPGTFQILNIMPDQSTQHTHLRVLIVADVATESTPALGMDLQGGDNFCVIPCRKVGHKLHSVGLTLVREQVSEVCCHRNGRLTQLHQSVHVRLKRGENCSMENKTYTVQVMITPAK